MLDWSMTDLAKAAAISVSTVKRVEAGNTHPISDASQSNIRRALELAGVRFARDADGGIALQMRMQPSGRDPLRSYASFDRLDA